MRALREDEGADVAEGGGVQVHFFVLKQNMSKVLR